MAVLTVAAVLAALASIVVSGSSPAGAHDALVFGPIPNYGNKKCIDLATENNSLIQPWGCNGQRQQQWYELFVAVPGGNALQFISQKTGSCLGVDGDSTGAGARVLMQVCGSPSTNWTVSYANNFGDGWHQQLRNLNSGLCLDLLNNDPANGTPIQQ